MEELMRNKAQKYRGVELVEKLEKVINVTDSLVYNA